MRPTSFARLVAGVLLVGTPAAAPAQAVLDFTTGHGGFTASGTGAGAWAYGSAPAPLGGAAWSTNGQPAVGTFGLASPAGAITVAAAGPVTGSFSHRFDFEDGFDGGQLQYRIVGDPLWTNVPASLISGTTYSSSLSGEWGSPIADEWAFTGRSAGYETPQYVTSHFTLGDRIRPTDTDGVARSFAAGTQIQIRFFAAFDTFNSDGNPDWQIGGLTVSNAAPVPEPAGVLALAVLAGVALRR